MSSIPILMPQMGQSIAQGVVVNWHHQVGDEVKADEILVEVESDKISFEVGSPASGILASCLVAEGESADVGSIIGTLDGEGTEESGDAEASATHDGGEDTRKSRRIASVHTRSQSIETSDLPPITRDWLSPSVARMAVLNNVTVEELSSIRGAGKGGRITRNDLMAHLARRGSAGPLRAAGFEVTGEDSEALGEMGEVIPMTSIRRTIADHMVQSIHTSAHVTMVHAVDTTRIVDLRERIKAAFETKYGVKMSYTSVILYVAAQVLREFPHINASVFGSNIVLRSDISIGCAVALDDQSLVVPVVKDADKKTFPEITCELDRLIKLARSQSLSRSDVEGGTFTISNFGSFGSLYGTPIINQPQVAILGMGAITKTFVPVEGRPEIRDILYLSFSFDHRVIDGALGGRFLNRLQASTEALTAESLGVADLQPET